MKRREVVRYLGLDDDRVTALDLVVAVLDRLLVREDVALDGCVVFQDVADDRGKCGGLA